MQSCCRCLCGLSQKPAQENCGKLWSHVNNLCQVPYVWWRAGLFDTWGCTTLYWYVGHIVSYDTIWLPIDIILMAPYFGFVQCVVGTEAQYEFILISSVLVQVNCSLVILQLHLYIHMIFSAVDIWDDNLAKRVLTLRTSSTHTGLGLLCCLHHPALMCLAWPPQ